MTVTTAGVLEAEEAKALCERALALSEGRGLDGVEVVLQGTDDRLTRFANSEIHQNVAERDLVARLRVAVGGRLGVAATNDCSTEGLARALATAERLARLSPADPGFRGFPEAAPIPAAGGFEPQTAESDAEDRADVVAAICRATTASNLLAFGAFRTAVRQVTVANSRGVFAHHVGTVADVNTVAMGDGTSGYAAWCGTDVRQVDGPALGDEAVARAVAGRDPRDLAPGTYPVLLSPYAVADLVEYLSFMGLGARSLQDGSSFLAGRIGETLCSDRITLVDDALDPAGLVSPFDFEGVPTRRVPLIERGVGRGVVYDSATAAQAGRESTGHALPAPNPDGPVPTHLHLLAGTGSWEDMLGQLDRGLVITRFHYVNVLSPKRTVLTGMTRDGTFWVEDGEVVHAVKNLRFTQSVLEALSGVRDVGREAKLEMGYHGATRAPALLLDGFTFSGRTE